MLTLHRPLTKAHCHATMLVVPDLDDVEVALRRLHALVCPAPPPTSAQRKGRENASPNKRPNGPDHFPCEDRKSRMGRVHVVLPLAGDSRGMPDGVRQAVEQRLLWRLMAVSVSPTHGVAIDDRRRKCPGWSLHAAEHYVAHAGCGEVREPGSCFARRLTLSSALRPIAGREEPERVIGREWERLVLGEGEGARPCERPCDSPTTRTIAFYPPLLHSETWSAPRDRRCPRWRTREGMCDVRCLMSDV